METEYLRFRSCCHKFILENSNHTDTPCQLLTLCDGTQSTENSTMTYLWAQELLTSLIEQVQTAISWVEIDSQICKDLQWQEKDSDEILEEFLRGLRMESSPHLRHFVSSPYVSISRPMQSNAVSHKMGKPVCLLVDIQAFVTMRQGNEVHIVISRDSQNAIGSIRLYIRLCKILTVKPLSLSSPFLNRVLNFYKGMPVRQHLETIVQNKGNNYLSS